MSSAQLSALCLASWLLLVALQLQLLPPFRYGWGFNFWAYLPPGAAWALAAASLLVCVPRLREGLARGAAAAARARLPGSPRVRAAAGLGACFVLFWLLRERELLGDSRLILLDARRSSLFVFPDIGATFLLQGAYRAGRALGVDPVAAVQVPICACGALAVGFLVRAGRSLAPAGGSGGALAALVLSGGLVRVFVGHVEVYAFLLAAAAAYLDLALAALAGRRSWRAPALALGIAVWVHLAALALLPSLVAGLWLASRQLPARRLAARGLEALVLAGLPALLFLAAVALLAGASELAPMVQKAQQIAGRDPAPGAVRWWVRGWGGAPSIGTDVVWLSAPHLKYLLNACWVLAPASLPVLLVTAAAGPRRLVEAPAARFLLSACVPLLLYATLLRPFWGPYDWDLFSITALCLAALSAHLLAQRLRGAMFRNAATWLIAFQLCFVSLPFVAIGLGDVRPAGPFVPGGFQLELGRPRTPPPESLAPWL